MKTESNMDGIDFTEGGNPCPVHPELLKPIVMKKQYEVLMTYPELQTLKESLEFTEMMGDVDGSTELKEKIENIIMDIDMAE